MGLFEITNAIVLKIIGCNIWYCVVSMCGISWPKVMNSTYYYLISCQNYGNVCHTCIGSLHYRCGCGNDAFALVINFINL